MLLGGDGGEGVERGGGGEVKDMREGSLGTLRNRGTRNWKQFKNQKPKFTTKYLYDSMAESKVFPSLPNGAPFCSCIW